MKYCEHIAHTLSFDINHIMPCCTGNNKYAPKHFSVCDNNEEHLSKINLDASQKLMFEELNSPNLENYSCSKCIFLKNIEEQQVQNTSINSLFLRFWTECNCNCVYCDNKRSDKQGNSFGLPARYSPYDFIKRLYE